MNINEIWFYDNNMGKIIFYPFGLFGKGVILNAEEKMKIMKFLSIYTYIGETLFIALIVILLVGVEFIIVLMLSLLFSVIGVIVYCLIINRIIKSKKLNQPRKSISSVAVKMMNSTRGIACLIMSLIMFILMIIVIRKEYNFMVILAVLFFGCTSLILSLLYYIYRVEIRKEKVTHKDI